MSFKPPRRASFTDFPQIRRTRGFRLYTVDGRRLLDLYQESGRGMLGSRPPGLINRFKGVLEKNGASALPSVWEGRLTKLLRRRFPDYPHVSLCSSWDELNEILRRRLGDSFSPGEIWDPWDQGYGAEPPARTRVSLWRPFLPTPQADYLVPVIPGAGIWGATPLLATGTTGPVGLLSESTRQVPAFLLAPQSFAGGKLFEWESRPDAGAVWSGFPHGPWERIGPYLFPRCNKADYPAVRTRLLSCGLFPSPEYPTPSIIPAAYTPGELDLLRNEEGSWPTIR